MENLIVIITSPDRPGIVERITEVVVNGGGNWEESQMARLCGDFAGIVRVTVAEQNADSLLKSLEQASDEETSIVVKRARAPVNATEKATHYKLYLKGADHEGIVHAVSARLAERGINIEQLGTIISAAPVTGTPIFELECRIRVPANRDVSELEEMVENISDELSLDITLASA